MIARRYLLVLSVYFFVTACRDRQNKLTILGENSSSIQAMQALKQDYEKDNSVTLDFRPNTFEDAFNKANQDFANKTAQYDIVLQYNFSLSSFIRNNYVYKLNELKKEYPFADSSFEKDIFSNVWKEVGYYYTDTSNANKGDIAPVAYPFAANTMLLVYNKEMFDNPEQQQAYLKKYGEPLKVPTDLASFQKVAAFFTQPEKNLHGVCLQGSVGGWLYYEWCGFLQAFNGKVLDKDQGWKGDANTPVLLASPEAVKATDYYLSLKPYNAGSFFTTDGVEQRNILKKGNVAMGLIWSDYMWGLIDDGNGKMDKRFGFTPTPGTKSMIAGGSYFINRQSKNTAAAFDFVRYLLKPENQAKMIQHGLCSPLKSAYESPGANSIPYAAALKQSLERAEYMLEAGPDADLINNVITKYIQKIWNGEMKPADGLAAAKADIETERKAFYK